MSKQEIENGKVRVFALGGVGEIGKNMYGIEVDEDIIVVDAGLMFPDDDMLGVDIVIPDVSYLVENEERVKGIILTHGHEDHIGGLSYVLKKINVPVYGTKLTLGLVEEKLKEAGILKETTLRLIDSNSRVKLGKTPVSFFRTSHSIPDCVGVCIETSQGAVVHTGDFKFDQTPVDGKHAEIGKMAAIGQKGVLCLLSDSTNAERPGTTKSEAEVGIGIKDVFARTSGRLIVTSFASNVHRLQQVIQATAAANRKLSIVGKSMVRVITIASKLGYLKMPKDLVIDIDEVNRYKPEQVVILTTGSQGEPMSALTRMARGAHRHITITENDTVIIAASAIPGNEKSVSSVIDQLHRIGADVVYGSQAVHASGHGSQEELKLMLNLMKPKYFLPIHGEIRMQHAHRDLGMNVGIKPERIYIVEKGEVVEFSNNQARRAGKVPSGHVLIDGLGVGDVGNIVLRDRRLLSKDGILVVVVTLNKKTSTIVSGPNIISRGFVYVRESEALLDQSNELVSSILQKCVTENVSEWSSLKSNIREGLSRFLFEKTKRRPMILPIIMEV
ncbi:MULTISPECIES: ribonuclease J [Shouchella]|uniref:Ribonuclease J n=3 Tax=Bacillaceae TaxID=186817 RepID=A0A060M2J7_9BACI|nr:MULTISPECIES: ribonuclease J [Bacillaceae]RQW20626.1 ribonuclease J [Bacillus sp. C1-1]AIC94778.1 ribonuclease J [Shouchella lehensis G1]KQL58685.1 Zn-dependent hydrolase [Alkalicoccobacillus plakortidis]MBG9784362.1 Zn-dependent hydrolase [Shouchella lehensis]TES50645.1 ribonuclease J [Shouchella lehensis]